MLASTQKQRKVSDVDLGVCRCTGVEFGGQWSDLSAAHLLRTIPPKWLFKLAHLGIKAIVAMCVRFLISRYLFVFFFFVFVYPIGPKNIDHDKASHVTIHVSQNSWILCGLLKYKGIAWTMVSSSYWESYRIDIGWLISVFYFSKCEVTGHVWTQKCHFWAIEIENRVGSCTVLTKGGNVRLWLRLLVGAKK